MSNAARAHPSNPIADEMAEFPFFRNFPRDFLEAFAALASEREFRPGERLLEQGRSNNKLFFLRSGRLSVLIDGEPVAELATPGEVIGEMSLINRAPIAASVQAVGAVSTFEVSEERLATMASADRERCQNLLDRVYASVLADRLARTNEKAKGFESANRELSKTQERLKKINESLEEELARRAKELVRKVQSLTESHLRPAHAVLSKWSHAPNSPLPPSELADTMAAIAETIDFLKPVGELMVKGTRQSSRAFLMLDKSRKQQNVARLALGGTGVTLSMASDLDEFEACLAAQPFDAIICEAEFREAALKAAQMQPEAQLVLMVGTDMRAYLDVLQAFPGKAFFVSRDSEDRAFNVKNISATANKILNKNIFGLERHLSWGTRFEERSVRSSDERDQLIEEMCGLFKSLGIRDSLLDRVRTAAEELLMNAIYDAPVDASGKALYNHLPRTEQVTLKREHEGSFRYGTDGMLLAISVSDPFGGLTRSTIMKYLDSCLTGQAGTLNKEKGGAGRGLKMMIDSADVTVFNIAAGRKTEVISLFNVESDRSAAQSTFHLFIVG